MSKKPTTQLPPPTPIALVLCDNIYQASNGKQALVGLFNRIAARNFPAVHPRMCAFASITSIRPDTQCSLDIVHAETDDPIIEVSGPAPTNVGPTTVWDVMFELPALVFPAAGRYYVRFLGNGQVLMQRPFEVVDLREMIKGPDDDSDN